MANDTRAVLWAAMKEKGITMPDLFEERYGIPLRTLDARDALELVRRADHPRCRDGAEWTPIQRTTYCNGCICALERLKERLDRGLLILAADYSLAAEVRWFRLATRAVRIIGRLAWASPEAERDFLCSETGSWYTGLVWPEPSPAARRAEW